MWRKILRFSSHNKLISNNSHAYFIIYVYLFDIHFAIFKIINNCDYNGEKAKVEYFLTFLKKYAGKHERNFT